MRRVGAGLDYRPFRQGAAVADVLPFGPVGRSSISGRAGTQEGDPLGRILACRTQGDITACIMEPLASRLSASSYIYFQFEQLHRSGHFIAGQRYRASDDGLFSEYCDSYFGMDPLLAPFQPWFDSRGSVGGDDLVVSLSELPGSRDGEFSQRFLRRYGVGDIVGLGIPVLIGTVQKVFCLGFQRPADAPQFTRSDKSSMWRAAPALRCVLENMARQEALALSSTVLGIVSDVSDSGYVLLDSDLLVRDASQQGLAHLGMEPSSAAPALLGEVRERLLHAAPGDWPPGSGVLAAGGARGVAAASITARSVPHGGEHWWLLLTAGPGDGRRFDAACRTGRLSPREVEVARMIVAGTGSPTVGKVLGIAVRTVENHLRSVYAKCGVTNRTQLAAKMLGH